MIVPKRVSNGTVKVSSRSKEQGSLPETRSVPKRSLPTTTLPRILIVDDHPIVRRGLRNLLLEAFEDGVIGEASSSQEGLDLAWKQTWDVAILDVTLPGRSGLELLKELRIEHPKMPIIVLSMHSEDQLAVRAVKSGAASYLTKECIGQELVDAVRKVLAGGKYISATLAERLASHVEQDMKKPLHENLSDREFQVMSMIASGKMAKQIADELSLSIKTVSTYRTRILAKMHLSNNSELMRYAIKNNLVS